MIFIDTGAWFAALDPSDQYHSVASYWLSNNSQPLMTTDFIADETLTLLRAKGQPHLAIILGRQLFSGKRATLYYLTPDDIIHAWQVFEQYKDKDWSFTDCTSKVVMEKLGMTTAFTFDHHFRQFGGIIVVP